MPGQTPPLPGSVPSQFARGLVFLTAGLALLVPLEYFSSVGS